MPLNYFDTSALAKRYLPELGSAWVRRTTLDQGIAVSVITLVEMASILRRRHDTGHLSADQRDDVYLLFLQDAQDFAIVDLSRGITSAASQLVLSGEIRLRTLDALQLATARAVLDATETSDGDDTGTFICADKALLAAARQIGLTA